MNQPALSLPVAQRSTCSLRSPIRRLVTVTTLLLFTPNAEAWQSDAASVFQDAVAVWHMQDEQDSTAENSRLTVHGKAVRFNQELSDEQTIASRKDGGDGRVAYLQDASLLAGNGIDDELDIPGDQLTLLMRLKNQQDNWDRTLFSKHGGHQNLQYNIFCFDRPGDATAEIGFELYANEQLVSTKPEVRVQSGQWYTLLARYNGKTAELFCNGQRVGMSLAQGGLRNTGRAAVVLGGEMTADGTVIRPFTGWIDHAAIWNRALSDEEIQSLSSGTATPAYSEPLRPQVHFSPPRNWINDPNGLLFANGEYHLFYQYNPFGNRWGHMSWGHAVSTDLLHWEHLPVALPETGSKMIFSGSAVFDRNNTSGFGTNDQGPLVAIYTAHETKGVANQSQAIAYSNDRGRTWTFYSENPVIDLNDPDFRDPKVFWYEPDQKWVMAVVLAKQRKVLFFNSKDLKQWTRTGEFGREGVADSGLWECPELLPLPVDGDPSNIKWVLQVSIGKTISGGTGGLYFVGEFDGRTFRNDNPADLPLWVDYGRDFYALQAWNGIPETDGRRVWIGWLNNWSYANDIPTAPWRGSMSIPREVSLATTRDGVRLRQAPIRELKSLRGEPVVIEQLPLPEAQQRLADQKLAGKCFDIEVTFRIGTARRFGLRVLKSSQHHTAIGYDLRLDEMFVNRRWSGNTDFARDFRDHQWAPLPPADDDRISLRILVDHSVVEVFVADGSAVITDRVFPSKDATRLELFADPGTVTVESLKVFPLQSVWSTDQSD